VNCTARAACGKGLGMGWLSDRSKAKESRILVEVFIRNNQCFMDH
jgi:hypothetical protein